MFLLFSLVPGFVAPYDPIAFDYQHLSAPPSLAHWFGTDRLGRDLFARTLEGTRVSLAVGLVASAVSLFVGISYGAVSGYIGGRTDHVMICPMPFIFPNRGKFSRINIHLLD